SSVSTADTPEGAGHQNQLSFITGGRRSNRQVLIDTWLAKFGASPAVSFELFDNAVLRQANALSFGQAQLPTFDLKNARFVISFGADFLGTWNSPVAQSMGYGHMRAGRPARHARIARPGRIEDDDDGCERGRVGTRETGHARCAGTRHRACDSRTQTEAGHKRASQRPNRGLGRGPSRLLP